MAFYIYQYSSASFTTFHFVFLTIRPVARGVGVRGCDAPPPKSAKRSAFSHKVAQKWGFCRRVKGVKSKKSTFRVQKVHLLGVSHLPTINPGYGPAYHHSTCLSCEPKMIVYSHKALRNYIRIRKNDRA